MQHRLSHAEETLRANYFRHVAAGTPAATRIKLRFWPDGWWKLMEYRIGIISLPVYVILLALIAGFAITGKVPGEISMAIAVLAFFGFTCAEIGKRLPTVRNIGAAAAVCDRCRDDAVGHRF